MGIITLTTDYGTRDYYVAAVKGVILRELPDVTVIDISHKVEPFNITDGAFIFKNAYTSFPQNTVHIVDVNDRYEANTRNIALTYKGQYFIGPDNGIFSLIFKDHPDAVYELPGNTVNSEFSMNYQMIDAACKLANNETISSVGSEVQNLRQRTTILPIVQEHLIRGSVIYIDNYYNVITNITKQDFESIGKGRDFVITYHNYADIIRISQDYQEVEQGTAIALFNSSGYLEIAVPHGRASKLLGLNITDTVQIEFR